MFLSSTSCARRRCLALDCFSNGLEGEIYFLDMMRSRMEKAMANLLDRITINHEQCGGRPCIRGMRIRVIDVLDLFAAGLSPEQILEEMPDLQAEDLQATLQYAARSWITRCSPHEDLDRCADVSRDSSLCDW